MTEPDENAFVEQIRRQLDSQAEQLDELTIARLRAARLRALASAPPQRRLWLPAIGGATLAAALLAVVLWQAPPELPGPFEALDIVASSEELEMIEDLDFYDWLEATQTTG